jgi:hypothetical protein
MEESKNQKEEIQKVIENSFITELKTILGSEFQESTILTFQLVKLFNKIPTKNEKQEVMEFMLTNFGDFQVIPKTGILLRGEPLSDEIWQKSIEENAQYIEAVFNRLIFKRPSSKDFAEGIFKLLDEFKEDEDKTCVLTIILRKDNIPYVQIPQGGIFITEKRFNVLLSELKVQIKLLNSIEHAKFKNNTQMASLMLGVINSGKTDEEKATLMTMALSLEFNRGKNSH